MKTDYSPVSFRLSLTVIILAFIASAGGLVIDDLYRDSHAIRITWICNDAVTMFVALPLLAICLWQTRKGSLRAKLVWMGLMAYMVYNYAFYLFGASFNPFFLLYTALFSLSVFALITGLSDSSLSEVKEKFSGSTPVRPISIFLAAISLPLAIVEVSQILSSLNSGKPPAAPSLIYALDLSLIVPVSALAAIYLWKRKSWGYILAMIMLVKSFLYGLVLVTATLVVSGGSENLPLDPLLPFYLFLVLGGMAGSVILFNHCSIKKEIYDPLHFRHRPVSSRTDTPGRFA